MILTEPPLLQAQSELSAYIIEQIRLHAGKISFAKFMQHALYAPGLGYYNNGSVKFGTQGDFVTAPELGNLFAQCLARQCAQILPQLAQRNIMEFGAGSGKLACDLLHALEIENYFIVELSAELRARQQDYILQHAAKFAARVHWLDRLPADPIAAIIIANEVLDAMPVARFYYAENNLSELYVAYKEEQFAIELDNPSDDLKIAFNTTKLTEYISQPYCSEINLWLQPWITSISACLQRGVILLSDYGFPRHEYYHPQRNNGTLMCHYQHHCHADPFKHLGLQDITAHVDFTAVAEAAHANDLEIAGYTNQANFLLNCGIVELIRSNMPATKQELNILTSPAEMGELFKVMALAKDFPYELLGFNSPWL